MRAISSATLASDLALPVIELGYREAQSFPKGAVLVEFDCRRLRAELRSAEAQHKEMSLTLQSNIYLAKRSAMGRHDVEIARARAQRAEGEVDAMRARVSQCRVVAPFAGSVSELGINQFETPPSGQPFMKIVSEERFEIEAIVPSRWLTWLRPGRAFAFAVDELGRTISASVLRIGRSVDPVSQTVKVYARPESDRQALRSGMSGVADFTKDN